MWFLAEQDTGVRVLWIDNVTALELEKQLAIYWL